MDSWLSPRRSKVGGQTCSCKLKGGWKQKEVRMGWGREQKDSTGQAQDCQQSSVKTCHSWSLHSLLGDWRGMHWSFIPQNRQCSFAPSTLCTTIVSARTLFRRILCPFRFLEVPFQDIHRDPLRSQDQTAVQDQAEVAPRWVCQCVTDVFLPEVGCRL